MDDTFIISVRAKFRDKKYGYNIVVPTNEVYDGDELAWMKLKVITHSMQNEMTEVQLLPVEKLRWEVIPQGG